MGKESWSKYGMEKGKGTAIKSGAFMEAKEEGFAAAMSAPSGPAGDQILKNAVDGIWSEARKLTEEARKISLTVNNQKLKEEREAVLDLTRIRSEERRVGKECRSRGSPYH